ncbi:hypothetical protein R3Q06_33950 [Rhodococcus erythropolis]|uniref:hypothetical protein n=1 Tax=Rhodococcus erythropolis TaxID=1833 RepID=UPI002948F9AE|nr:hypothetical protein [Rhodococcus erythropolis]MDV6278430.1 hypothetical protein [Rhodococcus erythropolis]
MTAGRTTTSFRGRAARRQLLYMLLAVGVLTGAIGVEAGVGVAAPLPGPVPVSGDGPPSSGGDLDWWSLYNRTGQPIYGHWGEQTGNDVSNLDLVKDIPLQDGLHESRRRTDDPRWLGPNPYWWAHICFDHGWWNLNGLAGSLSWNGAFTLYDDTGALKATWNDWDNGLLHEIHLTRNTAEAPC